MSKKNLFWVLSILPCFWPSFARAAPSPVITLHEKQLEWRNTNCEKTQSCDLTFLKLTEAAYQVTLSKTETSYGTRMFAEYGTQSVESLEKYGLAQFIRGCQFTSYLDESGQVQKRMDISRHWGNGTIPFHHPKWVLDRVSADPLDWGFVTHSPIRHFYYRWNTVANSKQKQTQKYYGYEKPTVPLLYVRDLPGAAFILDGEAKNISLEFKVCLYKSSEVPLDVPPDQTEFAKPLTCLSWSSSWIYDFNKKSFVQNTELDDFCK